MDSITTRLFGGLGNQLFQYATGRAVALRNDCTLLLDTRDTEAKGSHWQFALSHFNIHATVGNDNNLPPARTKPLQYYPWRVFGRSPKFTREKQLGYNPDIAGVGPNTYLHGYFQSEKYFTQIEDIIRRELSIKTPPSDENTRWLKMVNQPNSVSLHVRRGDYIAAGNAYAVCDHDYYKRAIDLIASKLDADPSVFIFSDDPAWAKENIKLGYKPQVSAHNDGSKPYEALRLISHCPHNITANSPFSWWGSWLNNNPEKIIVAPKAWFGKQNLDNPDLIPYSWHVIE
jgi:hypothetical protein